MNQAPVRQDEPEIPFLEPDNEESKTNPRLIIPPRLLPLVPAPWACVRAAVKHAQAVLSRLKLAPAIVLGALLGSTPYLVQQHVRARVSDEPQDSAPAQLSAAKPAPAPAPAKGDDEHESRELKPRPARPSLERALLMQARRQLRQGDGFGAQLVLQRLDQRVPHGKLTRQRKLLEIEVLQALGAEAAARRAASEFAKSYPQSRELSKLSALLLGS